MDAEFQAMRGEIYSQVAMMLEIHKKDLFDYIERVDRDRKRTYNQTSVQISLIKEAMSNSDTQTQNIDQSLKQLQARYQQKIIQIQQEIETIKSAKSEEKDLVPIEERVQSQIMPELQSWENSIVNLSSRYLDEFILGEQNTITKRNLGVYRLLGSIPIAEKRINQFKITQSHRNKIMFGIIDEAYNYAENYKEEQTAFYIRYSASHGHLLLSQNFEYEAKMLSKRKQRKRRRNQNGEKCKIGQILTMEVQGKTIYWRVGQEVRAQFTHSLFGDNSIKWVPFISMIHQGDTIQWK